MQDRDTGGVVFQHVGREHPGRHLAQCRLHGRGHLGHRHIDFDVRVEVDLDDAVAAVGLRLDVLDVVDVRSEAALETGDDALFHFFGRQSGINPQDADDRDIDIGKDIHRHSDDGRPAQDGDQDRHDDKGIRAAKSQPDNPHSL